MLLRIRIAEESDCRARCARSPSRGGKNKECRCYVLTDTAADDNDGAVPDRLTFIHCNEPRSPVDLVELDTDETSPRTASSSDLTAHDP